MNLTESFENWKGRVTTILGELGLPESKAGMYEYCTEHSDISEIRKLPDSRQEFLKLDWETIFMIVTDERTIEPRPATGRLLILQQRQDRLKEMVKTLYPDHKFDWQAFPFENLWERYRKRSPKLHRIQALYRETVLEETQLIEEILKY